MTGETAGGVPVDDHHTQRLGCITTVWQKPNFFISNCLCFQCMPLW